jgi:hypothetical protein
LFWAFSISCPFILVGMCGCACVVGWVVWLGLLLSWWGVLWFISVGVRGFVSFGGISAWWVHFFGGEGGCFGVVSLMGCYLSIFFRLVLSLGFQLFIMWCGVVVFSVLHWFHLGPWCFAHFSFLSFFVYLLWFCLLFLYQGGVVGVLRGYTCILCLWCIPILAHRCESTQPPWWSEFKVPHCHPYHWSPCPFQSRSICLVTPTPTLSLWLATHRQPLRLAL